MKGQFTLETVLFDLKLDQYLTKVLYTMFPSLDRIVGGTEVKQDAKYPYQIWVQVTFSPDLKDLTFLEIFRAWGLVVVPSSTKGTY